jgi:hypothetical protein
VKWKIGEGGHITPEDPNWTAITGLPAEKVSIPTNLDTHVWETFVPKQDWSSLMTQLLGSLTKAEDELRLLHTDYGLSQKHRYSAKAHLQMARGSLKQLEDWL